MSDLTPEQAALQEAHQTRLVLQQAFSSLYKNLTDFVQRLNMVPNIKSFAIMNLDQGAMWMREGISTMQFNFQPTPPAASESEKKVEEISEKVESEPTAA